MSLRDPQIYHCVFLSVAMAPVMRRAARPPICENYRWGRTFERNAIAVHGGVCAVVRTLRQTAGLTSHVAQNHGGVRALM